MKTRENTSTASVEPAAAELPDPDGADIASAGLTRRRLLQHAGVLGLAAAAGGTLGAGRSLGAIDSTAAVAASASALTLTPEQEEGPFYVALEKIRKNITLGRPGAPLDLKLKLVDPAGKPIAGAACDIWQCDARGVYSDESSENTVGQTWLRGVQITDAAGVAEFRTIYPGHYSGRTTHIHLKAHIGGKAVGGTYAGGHVSHTGSSCSTTRSRPRCTGSRRTPPIPPPASSTRPTASTPSREA